MPATRDGKTWRSQFYYEDWQGVRHKKNKRGFKTKAEAEEWERNFRQQQQKDLDINFESFVEIYFADMENRLRESTIKNKRYVFDLKVTPYFKKKYQCAILLIGHMNKASGNKAAYRGMGSIDFFAVARSVLLVGRIEGEPNTRAVVQIKNNLAAFGHPKAFMLSEMGFHWLGDYEITADEVLGGIAPKANKLGNRQSKCFVNWQKQLIWCRVMKCLKWLMNRAFQREQWKMQRKNWASGQRKSITRGIGNWIQ